MWKNIVAWHYTHSNFLLKAFSQINYCWKQYVLYYNRGNLILNISYSEGVGLQKKNLKYAFQIIAFYFKNFLKNQYFPLILKSCLFHNLNNILVTPGEQRQYISLNTTISFWLPVLSWNQYNFLLIFFWHITKHNPPQSAIM